MKQSKRVQTESDDVFKNELEKFKSIFPQFITEGTDGPEIDFDTFKDFLNSKKSDESVQETEKYSFTWSGRRESFASISRPSTGTLKPAIDESIDFDNTENLFLEGDNLEVLKLLQKNYRGKIKMIYIDPPYNTGKDFVYRDNFKQGKNDYYEQSGVTKNGIKMETNSGDSGRYHSNWLSMMYPRLYLAKQLLSDDGVIFVSIDDNEQYHLRMLMNEVFGEENFVGCLKWKRKKQPSFLATHIAGVMEYIFVFSKNKRSLEKLSIEGTADATKKVINISNNESTRVFKEGVRVKLGNEGVIPKGRYLIKTMEVEYLEDVYYKNGLTTNEVNVISKFSNSQEKIDSYIEKGLLFITSNKGLRRDVSEDEIGKRKSITDLLLDWGDNQDSDNDMRNIFGNSEYFDYTKPTSLIINLIKSCFSEDEIILDFFAGSATTGHAVMDLNKQDDGNRKFILVQIPELTDEKSEAYKAGYKNIADISKDRLKKAIEKHEYNDGFKVFKLDQSNYNLWEQYAGDDEQELLEQAKLFTEKPLLDGYDECDVVYEILLKHAFSLNSDIKQDGKFYIISDSDDENEQKIFITFMKKIDEKIIENMNIAKTDILVCFDSALTDNQKLNFNKNYNLRVI